MRKTKKGENAALSATNSALGKGQLQRKQAALIIFTTTLSISPLKNAQKLNEIGIRLGEEYEVPYLKSDLRKERIQAVCRTVCPTSSVQAELLRVCVLKAGS